MISILMGFTCGIIGLPNVGKSTIFNSLTSAKAAAANFPFCTIEPNTGAVPVPDERLTILSEIAKSEKIVPTQITFVDIAGLIRGASKGEGLGNQFLGHIRNVDAVAHVVRCFEDENVIHVDGKVDPISDVETINTELILSDLESVQKQTQKLEKLIKAGDKDAKIKYEILSALDKHLSSGKLAVNFSFSASPEILKECLSLLLTAKPVLYVANVEESKVNYTPDLSGSESIDKLFKYAKEHNSDMIIISGKVESEISELPLEERKEYLKELGIEKAGLDRLTVAGYKLLKLITFFTVGPKETHAWTAESGTKAPQCAGKIHSDFEQGFIRAEVIGFKDFIEAGSEVKAKENGKLRIEGKEYIFQDGDIVHFRFNV